jgi:hypothetical protein
LERFAGRLDGPNGILTAAVGDLTDAIAVRRVENIKQSATPWPRSIRR